MKINIINKLFSLTLKKTSILHTSLKLCSPCLWLLSSGQSISSSKTISLTNLRYNVLRKTLSRSLLSRLFKSILLTLLKKLCYSSRIIAFSIIFQRINNILRQTKLLSRSNSSSLIIFIIFLGYCFRFLLLTFSSLLKSLKFLRRRSIRATLSILIQSIHIFHISFKHIVECFTTLLCKRLFSILITITAFSQRRYGKC